MQLQKLFDQPMDQPHHKSLDVFRHGRNLDGLHVKEDGRLRVRLGLRQQRVDQHAAAGVDEEGVGRLAEVEVGDLAEDGVDGNVDARHALETTVHEDRQTG